MIGKYKFLLVIFCLLMFVSMSSVCANDIDNVTVVDSPDVKVCDSGTFTDLENDINSLNPGDIYNIDKDYIFKYNSPYENSPKIIFAQEGVEINVDNVTINGNGHNIDGNFQSALFKVTGNNVKIFNLTFINSKYEGWHIPVMGKDFYASSTATYITDMSPVYWLGDNGLISDCVFSDNTAINGGAVTWMGNNGAINNTLFINNTARGAGGGLYIGGTNNTVVNSTFSNSISLLTGEAIYIDRKHNNITFSNITFKNQDFWVFDGAVTDIDVKYLQYVYYSKMSDKQLDLIPIFYKTIMKGNMSNLDENITYYAQYSNVTHDFSFTFIRNLTGLNAAYQKDYIFTNTTLNDVFASLINDDYCNDIQLAKCLFVGYNDKQAYESACSYQALQFYVEIFELNPGINDDFNSIKNLRDINFGLNVFYAPGSVFNSNALWYKESGFNVVNIFGNGARITASSDKRDENYWFVNGKEHTLMIYDLTVEGFNMAITNEEGYCILNNVVLKNNKMDYIRDRDDGAGLLNGGVVICNNCTFTNNYAKNGGAIFNQGILSLNNCTFNSNTGYGAGDNVLNVDQGTVFINGIQINGTEGVVTYVESISTAKTILLTAVVAGATLVAAILVGALTTVFTANPYIGTAAGVGVGVVVGGVLGSYTAYCIVSHQYNLKYNRISTGAIIVCACVGAGLLGGVIGGLLVGPCCSTGLLNICGWSTSY